MQLRLKNLILCSLLTLLSFDISYCQTLNWAKDYDLTTTFNRPRNIETAPDQGFVLSGSKGPWWAVDNSFILRTDAFGDTLWTHSLDSSRAVYSGGLELTADSSIVHAGVFSNDVVYAKYDLNGNIIWKDTLDMGVAQRAPTIHALPNGDFFMLVVTTTTSSTRIFKLDPNGNVLDSIDVAGDTWTFCINSDENLFVPYYLSGQLYWQLLDTSLNTIWVRPGPGVPTWRQPVVVDQTTRGDYGVMYGQAFDYGGPFFRGSVVQIDSSGSLIWANNFASRPEWRIKHLTAAEDSGIWICGVLHKPTLTPTFTDSNDVLLLHYDDLGNNTFTNTYHTLWEDNGSRITTVPAGGLAIGGYRSSAAFVGSQLNPAIYRFSVDATAFGNLIHGTFYGDANSNCILDSGEYLIPHQLAIASNPLLTFSSSDSLGEYSIWVDSGAYNIFSVPSYWSYWEQSSCIPDTFTHIFPNPSGDTLIINFPFDFSISCPELHATISSGIPPRPCSTTNYYIEVCNTGTIPADSASVIVSIDTHLVVIGASIPWTSVLPGNQFEFDLGTIPIGGCVNFIMNVENDCAAGDTLILGQAICSSVHAFPDSICTPPDSSWDSSSIALRVECIGHDTVKFEIHNQGSGDMLTPGGFTVIEDNLLIMNDTFQLTSGNSKFVPFVANGSSFILFADQSTGHPGRSQPSIATEGCGTNASGDFSRGFLVSWPVDDNDYFIDIDCEEVVGSWDPNDKMGFPIGVDLPHYIVDDQEIDYKIRFQNVGTDTAFRVVIRDTLSEYLDPTQIIPGVSSHAYDFKILGSGVLEFTFDPIALADSATNEPESHGFVMFRARQYPGNPPGTLIENRAGIYFDYNPPVITNTTYHTIGNNFWLVLETDPMVVDALEIKTFPNPFSDRIQFEWRSGLFRTSKLELYDIQGQLVRTEVSNMDGSLILDRQTLSNGIYVFRLWGDDQIMGTGKIMCKD